MDHRNKDPISEDCFYDGDLIVFGGSREPFTTDEFNCMKKWLNKGGRMMVMLGDGGEKLVGTNLNYLLEE